MHVRVCWSLFVVPALLVLLAPAGVSAQCDIANGNCTNPGYEGWNYFGVDCCNIYDYCESTVNAPANLLPANAYEACCPGSCPESSSATISPTASPSASASVSPSPSPTSETRFTFPEPLYRTYYDSQDLLTTTQPLLDYSTTCVHREGSSSCLSSSANFSVTLDRSWPGRFGQSFALYPGISFGDVTQMIAIGADTKQTNVLGQLQDTGSVLLGFIKKDLTLDWYWMDVVQDQITHSANFLNFTVGTNNGFGSSVEVVSDLDGDLLPELAIGSQFSDGTRVVDNGVDTVQAQGAVFVFLTDLFFVEIRDNDGNNYTLPYFEFKDYTAIGYSNGLAEVPVSKTQDIGVDGSDYYVFGRSLLATDINSDGHPELCVGAPGSLAGYKGDVSIGNTAFTYQGSMWILSLNNAALEANLKPGQLRWVQQVYPNNITGYGLVSTGLEFATAFVRTDIDFNNDGKYEYIISAAGANSNDGDLSVFSMVADDSSCAFSAANFNHLTNCLGTWSFPTTVTYIQHLTLPPSNTASGQTARARCGAGVTLLTDLNYDGQQEIAIGCTMRGYSNFGYFDGPGMIQILSFDVDTSRAVGSQMTLAFYRTLHGSTLNLTSVTNPGGVDLSPAAGYGYAIKSIGDVDLDGSIELLVGAPYHEVEQSDNGVAVVLSVPTALPSHTSSLTPSVSPSATRSVSISPSASPTPPETQSPTSTTTPSVTPSVTRHINTCHGPLQISTCSFQDTNPYKDRISGTLSCLNPDTQSTYNGTAEFWVAHITTNLEMGDPFDTDHVILGAWAYNSSVSTFEVSVKDVRVSLESAAEWYVLIAIVDTENSGYIGCPFAIVLHDIIKDDTPTAPTILSFLDKDGTGGQISGILYFNSTTSLPTNSSFAIYLATGSGQLSEHVLVGTIPFVDGQTDYSYNLTEPLLQQQTQDGVNQTLYTGFLWVVSQTPSRIENGVQLGLVESLNSALHAEDRYDEYYFLTKVSQETGNCPQTDATSQFGICSEFGSQMATLTWTTANTEQTFYEINGVVIEAIDVSDNLVYNIGLGSSPDNLVCDALSFGSWPTGTPASNWTATSFSDQTTFSLDATFAEFDACGFTVSQDGLSMTGTMVLEVWRRDNLASNSSSPAELRLSANIHISYNDYTHATVRGVFIENVREATFTGTLGSAGALTAEIQVLSVLSLYDLGFLGLRQNSEYLTGTDSMFAEHRLVSSDANIFYLSLERVWFSLGDSIDSKVELEVESTDAAFTNYDSPAHLGRYRFTLETPFVTNCRPCFMHVSSMLSVDQPSAKSLKSNHASTPKESNHKEHGKSVASRALIISSKSTATKSGGQSQTTHTIGAGLLASVAALTLARLL